MRAAQQLAVALRDLDTVTLQAQDTCEYTQTEYQLSSSLKLP
jgi:hypothetical protein